MSAARVQLFATCLADLVFPHAAADADVLPPRGQASRSRCPRSRSAAASRRSTRATARPPEGWRARSSRRSRARCRSSCRAARARPCSPTTCRSWPASSPYDVWELSAFLDRARRRAREAQRRPPSSPTTTRATCCASSRSTQRRAACSSARGRRSGCCRAPDLCCGFGGTFSVRQPEVSVAMADDKLGGVDVVGAEALRDRRSRLPDASGRALEPRRRSPGRTPRHRPRQGPRRGRGGLS